jgi:hypothetical protein
MEDLVSLRKGAFKQNLEECDPSKLFDKIKQQV